jgi:hypothetical protein
MKRLAYASLTVLLVVFSFTSFSADPSDRPAGVSAKEWVPVSDRLGVVLAGTASRPASVSPTALLLDPPVAGYFMVKGPHGWTRLVVIEPVKGPAGAG